MVLQHKGLPSLLRLSCCVLFLHTLPCVSKCDGGECNTDDSTKEVSVEDTPADMNISPALTNQQKQGFFVNTDAKANEPDDPTMLRSQSLSDQVSELQDQETGQLSNPDNKMERISLGYWVKASREESGNSPMPLAPTDLPHTQLTRYWNMRNENGNVTQSIGESAAQAESPPTPPDATAQAKATIDDNIAKMEQSLKDLKQSNRNLEDDLAELEATKPKPLQEEPESAENCNSTKYDEKQASKASTAIAFMVVD